ncbi:unnamed protein product, partial [marine sediment metagenome]
KGLKMFTMIVDVAAREILDSRGNPTVEPLYAKEVRKIMAALKEPEQKKLIAALEKIRPKLPQQQRQKTEAG